MNLSVENEHNVTVADILKEAGLIWKKVKLDKTPLDDANGRVKLLGDMQKEHLNFARAYPMVLRFMCEYATYTEAAFKRYLSKIQGTPWKNEKDFVASQVDYLVILYKDTHRNWKPNDVTEYRKLVEDMLTTEHEQMKKLAQDWDDKVKEKQKNRDVLEKKNLVDYLTKHQEFLQTVDVIPIKVISKTDTFQQFTPTNDVLSQLRNINLLDEHDSQNDDLDNKISPTWFNDDKEKNDTTH